MKNKAVLKAVSLLLCFLCLFLCSCNLDFGITPETTDAEETENVTPGFAGIGVKTGAYNGLFDGIMQINVTLGEAELSTITDHADSEIYCECDVTVGKETVNRAAIKPRGNTSYVTVSGSGRYSFKLKFDKYVKGQRLSGLDELYLNNLSYDPSCVREYLAYALFSLNSGISAPLATFAKVYINGEYYGLYSAVEAVDGSFLKRTYGENDGDLYKAGSGSAFLSDDTSTFTLERGQNTSLSKISDIYKAVIFGEETEQTVDVNSILRYAAVMAVVCGQESYLGAKAENYYLYAEPEGEVSIIPWDLKTAFGVNLSERKSGYAIDDTLIEASVTEPYFGLDAEDRPLVSKLLENEEYKAKYLSYVKFYNDALSEMLPKLADLKEAIDAAVSEDTNRFFSADTYEAEFEDGNNSLYGFIKARCENVKSQLAALGE